MSEILNKLRPYQKEGVAAALAMYKQGDRGFLIGDAMGLGKSVQALAIADAIRSPRVNLICPAGLIDKWKKEIRKHLPEHRDYHITIGSYSQLSKPSNLYHFTRERAGLTIIDEVHRLKDFNALQTRAILGAPGDTHTTVNDMSDKILGLSGTWPPNRVGETYSWLLRSNHPLTQGLTYEAFVHQYAGYVSHTPWGVKHKGVKNDKTFRELLKPNYIRRTMDDVMPEIPRGNLIDIPIEINAKLYDQEKEVLRVILTSAGFKKYEIDEMVYDSELLNLILKESPSFTQFAIYRKNCGLMKVKPVLEYIENRCGDLPKFMLLTYHTDVAQQYYDALSKTRKCTLITGKNTNVKDRESILSEAESSSDVSIIATMDAVFEGYDLISYHYILFTESDFRPHVIQQCMGRNRRFGQTKPTFWLMFTNHIGVEKHIIKLVDSKEKDLIKIRG